jgi:hypothetical protein
MLMTRLVIIALVVTGVFGAIGCWFAADRGPAPSAFDGKRAMGYLEEVCKIGPRISGTDGMKKQQELLAKHFEALGAKVEMQPFKAKQHSKPKPIDMANMIVSWYPDRQRRVIICSHYDTRPIADQEEDRRNWFKPFISANDGGSGVALLMELGHHMKDLKTQVGVDFVFFDGEEHVYDIDAGDKYFFGSEHFAQAYKKEKPKHTYLAAVLLDMIAGKDPAFPREGHSAFLAAPLQDELWKIAGEQQCHAFKDRMGTSVQDDHLALNRIAKIPTVDIIDFDYPHWHRLTDVPASCSSDGMTQVARVLSVWLQRVK